MSRFFRTQHGELRHIPVCAVKPVGSPGTRRAIPLQAPEVFEPRFVLWCVLKTRVSLHRADPGSRGKFGVLINHIGALEESCR